MIESYSDSIEDFQYSIAAEAFGIAESTTAEMALANSAKAYNPATGKVAIAGYHAGEDATRTIVLTTLRNNAYEAIQLTKELVIAMVAAIAGHTFAAATHVVTGVSEAGSTGQLLKSTINLDTLPFATE